ncbi:MAG: hypothetical protein H6833_06195 [Planctomycetes bacterium]|nr:hypothetical protein [Planctomycetota bacterium]
MGSALVRVLAFTAIVSQLPGQSSEGFVPVHAGSGPTYAPDVRIDLRGGATVDFWVKHAWPMGTFAFVPDDVAQEASAYFGYSIPLAFGGAGGMAFAVALHVDEVRDEGSGGTVRRLGVGVLNALDDLSTANSVRADGAGRFVAMIDKEIDPSRVIGGVRELMLDFPSEVALHIALVQRAMSPGIRVYVNGFPVPGSIAGSFGDTRAFPMRLGWDIGPNTRLVDGFLATQAKPFQGSIGNVRLWSSALGPKAIEELHSTGRGQRGRPPIPERGDLIAYVDAPASEWDDETGERREGMARLRFADPLVGLWRPAGAAVEFAHEGAGGGRMRDYPVFVVVPASRPDGAMSFRRYELFRDDSHVGSLSAGQGIHTNQSWTLTRGGGLDVGRANLRRVRNLAGRPEWRLEIKLADGFRSIGFEGRNDLVLEQPTLDDQELAHAEAAQDAIERVMAEKSGSADGDFFLFGNHVKYWRSLYGGFHLAYMDPYDHFQNGLAAGSETRLLFAEPEYFRKERNEGVLIPWNLGHAPLAAGLSTTESVLTRDSSEYRRVQSERIGASTDIVVTPHGMGVQQTIGFQLERIEETRGMESREESRLVTTAQHRKFAMFHRKEHMRLDVSFAERLRELRAETYGQHEGKKLERFDRFFREWGTHYAFSLTYGAMGWWETTLTRREVQDSAIAQWTEDAILGQGRTGLSRERGGTEANVFEGKKIIARTIGGDSSPGPEPGPVSSGTDPAPILGDLRPITELVSARHFPHEPEIYRDLRRELDMALAGHWERELDRQLAQLASATPEERAQIRSAFDQRTRPSGELQRVDLEIVKLVRNQKDPSVRHDMGLTGTITIEPWHPAMVGHLMRPAWQAFASENASVVAWQSEIPRRAVSAREGVPIGKTTSWLIEPATLDTVGFTIDGAVHCGDAVVFPLAGGDPGAHLICASARPAEGGPFKHPPRSATEVWKTWTIPGETWDIVVRFRSVPDMVSRLGMGLQDGSQSVLRPSPTRASDAARSFAYAPADVAAQTVGAFLEPGREPESVAVSDERARAPKDAVAYYPFSGHARDILANHEIAGVDAQRYREHGLVLSSLALGVGPLGDVEIPGPQGGAFTMHLDFAPEVLKMPDISQGIGQYDLVVRGEGTPSFGVSRAFPMAGFFHNSQKTAVIRYGEWNKVVLAVEEDGSSRIWINGVHHEWKGSQPTGPFHFPGAKLTQSGLLDELLFFDRALSWAEIEELAVRPRLGHEEDVSDAVDSPLFAGGSWMQELKGSFTKVPEPDAFDGGRGVWMDPAFRLPWVVGNVEDVAVQWTGYLRIREAGEYSFSLVSDDGSVLSLDGHLVVDNDGVHTRREASGKVRLETGLHSLRVGYFQGKGEKSLVVEWAGPGFERRPFQMAEDLFRCVSVPYEHAKFLPFASKANDR